jgi:peptidoglycan/LPS O-acetylase OafA/YrhL
MLLIINVGCNARTMLRLSHPTLDYLGRISYGIYMLHPLVIYGLGITFRELGLNPGGNIPFLAGVYVVAVAVTIALAALSYKLFEIPFLKLKKRVTRVESGGDDLPVGGLAGPPAALVTQQ